MRARTGGSPADGGVNRHIPVAEPIAAVLFASDPVAQFTKIVALEAGAIAIIFAGFAVVRTTVAQVDAARRRHACRDGNVPDVRTEVRPARHPRAPPPDKLTLTGVM